MPYDNTPETRHWEEGCMGVTALCIVVWGVEEQGDEVCSSGVQFCEVAGEGLPGLWGGFLCGVCNSVGWSVRVALDQMDWTKYSSISGDGPRTARLCIATHYHCCQPL